MNYKTKQFIYKAKDLTIMTNDKEYHFDGLIKSNINEFLGDFNPFDMNISKFNEIHIKRFDFTNQYDDLKVGKCYAYNDLRWIIANEYIIYNVIHKTKSYCLIRKYKYKKTRIINTQSYYEKELLSEAKWKYSKTKKQTEKRLYYDEDELSLRHILEYNDNDLDYIMKNNICYSSASWQYGNPHYYEIASLMKNHKRKFWDTNVYNYKNGWFNFRNCSSAYDGLIIYGENETQNLMNYYELMKFMNMLMINNTDKKIINLAKELLSVEFNKSGGFTRNRLDFDEVSSVIRKYE